MEFIYYIIIAAFILLAGYFSGTETAIISTSKLKLKTIINNSKAKKAKRVLALIENPDKVLSSLLVGTNLCVVSAASLSSMLFIRKYGESGEYYSTFVLTIIILIFGEILPKAVFRKISIPILINTIGFLEITTYLFTPFVNVIVKIVRTIPIFKKIKKDKAEIFLTREDLKTIFSITAKKGVIKEFDKKILYSVFDFGVTYAREIMVPLVDIVLISKNKKVIDVVKLSEKVGFSKIPVFEKQVYNIIGYINVNDLFKAKSSETLNKYIHKAYYVPETKKIDELFVEMNNKHLPIVFIVDEYGGVSGLITLEDIVEEIVGEIEDETNYREEESIKIAGKNEWLVSGGLDIDDLYEEIGLKLPKSGFETVAGFIEYHLGKIPKRNELFIYNNYQFKVIERTDRSIEKVKIKKIEKKLRKRKKLAN